MGLELGYSFNLTQNNAVTKQLSWPWSIVAALLLLCMVQGVKVDPTTRVRCVARGEPDQ